tara:strand:- start:4605 stop:5411 length:807 start_codon:yes stop_codon:yes gene_type:complete
MSNLRTKLIKLAYEKPELRKDLLPLVKVGMDGFHYMFDNERAYPKYAAAIRKALKPLGFKFKRLTKKVWKSGRNEFHGYQMDVVWGKSEGFIEIMEGASYYGGETDSRLLFEITLGSQKISVVQKGSVKSELYWKDIGSSQVREFIRQIEQRFSGLQDESSVVQNTVQTERAELQKLWRKPSMKNRFGNQEWYLDAPAGRGLMGKVGYRLMEVSKGKFIVVVDYGRVKAYLDANGEDQNFRTSLKPMSEAQAKNRSEIHNLQYKGYKI